MGAYRLSATEIFGVPVDKPEQLRDGTSAEALMLQYAGVVRHDLEEGPTDITPYYFQKAEFRYMLSRGVGDTAIVELLPINTGSETYALFAPDNYVKTAVRTIRVPTDSEVFAVAGPGPRFTGKICLHELVTYS